MSVYVMGLVFKASIPKSEKFLLLALADHAHDDGSEVRPGLRRLAAKTSDSERNVRRLLRSLEGAGLLIPVAHVQGGRGHATEYRIPLDALHALPDVTSDLKADNLSPFSAIKADTQGPKGGHPGSQRGTPTAPQPSGTVIEPRARPREPDPIWDHLLLRFGGVSNDDERGLRNRAVKLLRQSGATPVEIDRRMAAWPAHFGEAVCTPKALATHWSTLGAAALRGTRLAASRGRSAWAEAIPICEVCDASGRLYYRPDGTATARDDPDGVTVAICPHPGKDSS